MHPVGGCREAMSDGRGGATARAAGGRAAGGAAALGGRARPGGACGVCGARHQAAALRDGGGVGGRLGARLAGLAALVGGPEPVPSAGIVATATLRQGRVDAVADAPVIAPAALPVASSAPARSSQTGPGAVDAVVDHALLAASRSCFGGRARWRRKVARLFHGHMGSELGAVSRLLSVEHLRSGSRPRHPTMRTYWLRRSVCRRPV